MGETWLDRIITAGLSGLVVALSFAFRFGRLASELVTRAEAERTYVRQDTQREFRDGLERRFEALERRLDAGFGDLKDAIREHAGTCVFERRGRCERLEETK